MAVTDAQVRDWLDKNPNASDAEIASVAQQAGVDSTQLSRVTNISKDVIENRASTVGVDLSPQTIQNTEQQVTESVNQAAETVSDTEATNAFNKVVDRAKTGDMNAFGQLLYFARQSNNPLPKQFIEQIGYAAKDNKTDAYNYAVGAQAVAEGYEARDEALAQGNNELAQDLQNKLVTDPNNFYSDVYSVYRPEGQAHLNLRKETADGNPFDIGDPGEYQTSFWEGIGDVAQDIIDNPVFKMAIALNPYTQPFAPFIGAATTKLSGDEISGLQVAGMVASAPGALDQASTLAGTKYNTGMFSPQSVDLFSQQAGLEPNWFTLGEDVASGITTESDLLRGAQQGGVSAAAQALSGASDTDQLMAFINKQMVDLGGLDIPFTDINVGDVKGMLSGIEIPGLNVSLGDLPDYKLPGFDVALGDIPDFKIPGLDLSLNEINAVVGNLPDFNLPTGSLPFDVNLPEFAANFGDINIPNIDIPNIDIPNMDIPDVNVPSFEIPTFEVADVNIDIPDITLPNIRFRLPQLGGYTQFGVDSPIMRGGRGLFAGNDEEVQRISELLLAGLPQIGGAGS